MSGYTGLDPGPWTFGQLVAARDAARERQIELARFVWIAGFSPGSLPTKAGDPQSKPKPAKPNTYSGAEAARILETQFFPMLKRNRKK